ncbi:hypothetical protein, partial [Streptomyces fulvoviolaceus]|uniref:hypothetical protein n=1 Tax=Streptomyces fulvoviolaceus TaxID=285535 RepID=UPI0004C4CC40
MSPKRVRKMLRRMESGEPVELSLAMTTMKGLTRLAFIAEQFGYEYADLSMTGDNRMVLRIVPDPSPHARERATQNRARYPDASDGGALPPVVPEAIELLKARMVFDLGRQYTEKQRTAIAAFFFTAMAVAIGYRFAEGMTGVVITVAVWAAFVALLPVGLVVSRHDNAKYSAQLQAAGFTAVTDPNGRLRYVPPGGRLPGHGNPFA